MEYLIKVSAVIAIFYICYKLFLQRDTFFETNRWFLFLGLITSFLMPLIVIPKYIEYIPTNLDNLIIDSQITAENIQKPFNILDYLPIIYVAGFIFFLGRFLIQLTSLASVILKHKSSKKGRYVFIETNDNVSPFSFFKYIVYNPTHFNRTELEQIIIHEKVHANQQHSIDILLGQLSCIMLWFNPIIWFYNKDLKHNLEFIADKNALNTQDCKKDYQYTLLKTSMLNHQSVLTNNFYNSLIKKRIVMLHKSKSRKINLLKYAIVLPLLTLFLMSFNTKEVYILKEIYENKLLDIETPNTTKLITKDDVIVNEINTTENNNKPLEISKNQTNAQVISSEEVTISGTVTNSEGTSLPGTNIVVKGKNTGAITDFNGYYKIKVEKGDELIYSFIGFESKIITVKNQKEINIVLEEEKQKSTIKIRSTSSDEKPLIIIDGVLSKSDAIEKIEPENIKSIDVLKGESATDKYGEKGKNGVVIITSKGENDKVVVEEKPTSDMKFIITDTKSGSKSTMTIGKNAEITEGKKPLVVVDGKELDYEKLEKLNPNNIKSINVLKDKSATDKYGEKGKNGVLEIVLIKKD
jgi:bla regulator protein blaR1